MVRKWAHEREKEKNRKIWNRLHEEEQATEDMVWRAEWGTPKAEKYPYRPNGQETKTTALGIYKPEKELPDYANKAAVGWAKHQSDEAKKQGMIRDPGFQKWRQTTGAILKDNEDWHPKQDWSVSQNNRFGYLYNENPWEARKFAELVNSENRRRRELGSEQVRTGMPEKPALFERAGDFLTDAWNKHAEISAANSDMEMSRGLKSGEKLRKSFDSVGQSLAAQADMNRQAADGAAKVIKDQSEKAVKHWGDANSAYSEAQTRQAEKTRAQVEHTKQHWVNANKSYSDAQSEQARKVREQAAEASQEYGEIWALTSGVTGSDQTGASIYGYRKGKGHKGNQAEGIHTEEEIRRQISNGGIDVLGHAVAARGMIGGEALDGINQILEYGATGEITNDSTVTPGKYKEIVDEEIAKYLTKRNGEHIGGMYSKLTNKIDETVAAAMGPVGIVMNAIGAMGEGLNHALENGATNKKAINYGAARGVSSVANNLLFDDGKGGTGKTVGKQVVEGMKNVGGNIGQGVVEQVVQQMILGTNSDYNATVQKYYTEGFTKEQAHRIAKNEIRKKLIEDGISEALLNKIFDPIEAKLKR